MAFWSTFLSLFIIVLAVFIMYPAPELSPRLKQWQEKGQYFEYDGHEIFYIDEKGKGNAEDVLFISHGYPSSSYDFYKMWDDLTGKFGRVIAPDYLGYGFSDKPMDFKYSIFNNADVVTALLKKLKVNKVHILAHDMGDTVAQELVARDNDKKLPFTIQSLCLTNGGILPETLELRLAQKALLNKYAAPAVMRMMNRAFFGHGLSEVFGPSHQPTSEELDDLWAAFRYKDGYLVQARLIQYLNERFANRDRWVNALSNTKIPLHLIFGDSDPINPPSTFFVRFKKLVPNSGVTELPSGVGHYIQLEDPLNVVDAFFKFFDSLKKT